MHLPANNYIDRRKQSFFCLSGGDVGIKSNSPTFSRGIGKWVYLSWASKDGFEEREWIAYQINVNFG